MKRNEKKNYLTSETLKLRQRLVKKSKIVKSMPLCDLCNKRMVFAIQAKWMLCWIVHKIWFNFNEIEIKICILCCIEDLDIESIETSTLRSIRQIRQDAPERLNKRHKHSPDRKFI